MTRNPVYSVTTMHPDPSTAPSLLSSVPLEPSITVLLEPASLSHQDDLTALSVLGPLPAGSFDSPQKSQPAMPSMPSLSAAVTPPVSQPTKFTPDPLPQLPDQLFRGQKVC